MTSPEDCPVPGCPRVLPNRFSAVCADHHFLIPREYTKAITRMKIECAKTTDDDARAHLQAQLPSYVRLAISKLPQQTRASA